MVIMAILLTLAGFTITKSQANARDSQRKTDIAIISRGLETRYKEGNPNITSPSYITPGTYPSLDEMSHLLGGNVSGFSPSQISGGYTNDVLIGTDTRNFSPPGVGSGLYNGFIMYSCSVSCPNANDSAVAGSTIGNNVTKYQYYYEPIDADGKICNGKACVRYNLYWRSEVDDTSHILRSDHQ